MVIFLGIRRAAWLEGSSAQKVQSYSKAVAYRIGMEKATTPELTEKPTDFGNFISVYSAKFSFSIFNFFLKWGSAQILASTQENCLAETLVAWSLSGTSLGSCVYVLLVPTMTENRLVSLRFIFMKNRSYLGEVDGCGLSGVPMWTRHILEPLKFTFSYYPSTYISRPFLKNFHWTTLRQFQQPDRI